MLNPRQDFIRKQEKHGIIFSVQNFGFQGFDIKLGFRVISLQNPLIFNFFSAKTISKNFDSKQDVVCIILESSSYATSKYGSF